MRHGAFQVGTEALDRNTLAQRTLGFNKMDQSVTPLRLVRQPWSPLSIQFAVEGHRVNQRESVRVNIESGEENGCHYLKKSARLA